MVEISLNEGENQEIRKFSKEEYDFVPPDGGWGYVIMGAVTMMNIFCIVPLAAFGLLYGPFLASVGDETSGAALSTSIFLTMSMFTAFLADILLRKYSNRQVALTGALCFFTGSVGAIFMKNGFHMILSYGVFEGIGLGLMIPSTYTALITYFTKKGASFILAVLQTGMALFNMLAPYAVMLLVNHLGFRKTLMVTAGCSALLFPAMATLRPMKKHFGSDCKKVDDNVPHQFDGQTEENRVFLDADKENTSKTVRNRKILDLSLLRSIKYLNLVIGVSCSFASDGAFNSLLRVILNDINYDDDDVSFMATSYFGADLIARICFSILAAFVHIKGRNVFLIGTFFTGVVRIVFIMSDGYIYRTTILVLLGVFKCMIEIPMTTILAEEYRENYSNAMALQMIFNGTVTLIFGPLISLIKRLTGQNIMVIYFLTLVHIVCSISWFVELICEKMWKRTKSNLIQT